MNNTGKWRKPTKGFIIVILLLVIGFTRESLFGQLNAQIGVREGYYEPYRVPDIWSFLTSVSLSRLILLKWVFTLLFAFIFFGISWITIHLFFNSGRNKKIVIYTYGTIITLSGLAIGIGKTAASLQEPAYYFARWLMGAAQSPLLLMILVLAMYAGKKLTPPVTGGTD